MNEYLDMINFNYIWFAYTIYLNFKLMKRNTKIRGLENVSAMKDKRIDELCKENDDLGECICSTYM